MLNVKVIRCTNCGYLQAPPVYLCRLCQNSSLETIEVPGKGIIYTYSTVYVPLSILEKEAPYVIAIIELDCGCKITGRIVASSEADISIGAPVRLVECKDGVYFFRIE